MKDINGLLAKFILFPLVIYVSTLLLVNHLEFFTPGQILTLGWLIALALYLIDASRLSTLGPLTTSLVDFLVSAVTVWAFALIVKFSILITFWGVIAIALGIALVEYPIHRYLRTASVDLPQEKPRP
ncbi:MAG: DUF2512 family protein [Syntrophomonadaceae bacterium]|nr:DUF2512 family protein [Syntrophomonadaceae bacterium]